MFSLSSQPIERGPTLFPDAGGFVTFEGRVRNQNEGRQVIALEYEAFAPLAQSEGERLLLEVKERFDILEVSCVHRTGLLKVGELAVLIEVAASHRKAAFRACEFVIDELKKRVPIWKKEHYADGESEWLNPVEGSPAITAREYYGRQMRLPELAAGGQDRLAAAKVLVVGAGGLGCPALMYLAAAGVGTLGIAEDDDLALDNLHRQVLYDASEVGRPKGELAQTRLSALNPLIQVIWHNGRLSSRNVSEIVAGYDLVLDCTDNFATKFLLNDACVELGKKLIQASIYQYEGQVLAYDPAEKGPCIRCTWPEVPAEGCIGSCAEVGVLGVTPGVFGALQAAEALKLILGIGEPLGGDVLIFDLLAGRMSRLTRLRNPACPVCGSGVKEIPIDIEWEALEELVGCRLIDIREHWEVEAEPFPEATHIPMGCVELEDTVVSAKGPKVFVCSHGIRSAQLARELRRAGIEGCYSVIGGLAFRRRSIR